jgi:esterase/lipase superfamily enzyme
MPTSFMITNRKISGDELSHQIDLRTTSYFVSNSAAKKLTDLREWTKLSAEEFRAALMNQAKDFPDVPDEQNQLQKHVSLFIHGYNNGWQEAVQRYSQLQQELFVGKSGLGIPVLFTWPSNGMAAAYLPDREDARASAPQLADVFVHLHDHLSLMQRGAASNLVRAGSVEGSKSTTLCRAKVSVIAHSMGNYVLQNALAIASRKLNNPQLITLIHQLVMVAADVDNDIFQTNKPLDADGSLMSNLCYRICALYTGTDQILGASAGLKHFGMRRLGRSGLANRDAVWDNVFAADVSPIITQSLNTHSAVFDCAPSRELLADILRGLDRKILFDKHAVVA